jgi:glycosyltransferase involved in cell wall biosynthesis
MTMHNDSSISIAMATYNGEKYLKEQMDSIYNQSHKPYEVVVCDDGSTDNTVDILSEYIDKHGLKLFRNTQRLGYIKNFERAISICQGEYIALSDQDDIWLPNKLEILINNIKDQLLISTDALIVNSENEVIHESYAHFANLQIIKNEELLYYIFHPFVTGCTSLFKKDLAQRSMPFPDFIPHDFWLALHAKKNNGLLYSPQKLIRYRQHSSNTIGATPKNRKIRWRNIANDEIKKRRIQSISNKVLMFESICKNFELSKLQFEVIQSKIDLLQSHVQRRFSIVKLIRNLKYEKYSSKGVIASIKEILTYCSDTLLK